MIQNWQNTWYKKLQQGQEPSPAGSEEGINNCKEQDASTNCANQIFFLNFLNFQSSGVFVFLPPWIDKVLKSRVENVKNEEMPIYMGGSWKQTETGVENVENRVLRRVVELITKDQEPKGPKRWPKIKVNQNIKWNKSNCCWKKLSGLKNKQTDL